MMRGYGIRPRSAISRASIRCNRPRAPSLAARGDGSTSREMEVLMRICEDQGTSCLLNPTDFDSSVSAIINLPVTPFMGAAREGWGHYFRNLHGKMRPPGEPNCEEQWLGPSRRSISTAKRQKRRRTRHRPYSPSPIIATASTKPTTDRNSPQRDYRRRRKDDSNDAPLSRERSQAKAEQEQRIMENDMIRRMAARLQFLWQELKIPRPDRTYIVVMYLAGRFAGAANEPGKLSGRTSAWNKSANREEVQRELTRQTTLLLAYRIATIKVLRLIDRREWKLLEVKRALESFQWHRGRDTDAETLLEALVGLRNTSRDVIGGVMEWRRELWQPRAFCWHGVNYLEKMSTDAKFLRSPAGVNLLASVGLEISDMAFVLFPTGDKDDPAGIPSTSAESDVGMTDIFPPPSIVRFTPGTELVTEYRSRFFAELPPERGNITAGASGTGFEATKVAAAARIANEERLVVQESALQKRLQEERARLATEGCFVPLLRWLPMAKNVPNAKRRPQSAAFPSSDFQKRDDAEGAGGGEYSESGNVSRGGNDTEHIPPPALSIVPTMDGQRQDRERPRRLSSKDRQGSGEANILADEGGVCDSEVNPGRIMGSQYAFREPTLGKMNIIGATHDRKEKATNPRQARPAFVDDSNQHSHYLSGDVGDPKDSEEPKEKVQTGREDKWVTPLPLQERDPPKGQARQIGLEPPPADADYMGIAHSHASTNPQSEVEAHIHSDIEAEADAPAASNARGPELSTVSDSSPTKVEISAEETKETRPALSAEKHVARAKADTPSQQTQLSGAKDGGNSVEALEDSDTEKTAVSTPSSCGCDIPSRGISESAVSVQPQSHEDIHRGEHEIEPNGGLSINKLLYDEDFENEDPEYSFTDSEGYSSHGQDDTGDATVSQESANGSALAGEDTDGRESSAALSTQRARREADSAVRIQTIARRRQARAKVNKIRHRHSHENTHEADAAAVKIQRMVQRRNRVPLEQQGSEQESEALMSRLNNRAAKIQALVRRKVAENEVKTMREEKQRYHNGTGAEEKEIQKDNEQDRDPPERENYDNTDALHPQHLRTSPSFDATKASPPSPLGRQLTSSLSSAEYDDSFHSEIRSSDSGNLSSCSEDNSLTTETKQVPPPKTKQEQQQDGESTGINRARSISNEVTRLEGEAATTTESSPVEPDRSSDAVADQQLTSPIHDESQPRVNEELSMSGFVGTTSNKDDGGDNSRAFGGDYWGLSKGALASVPEGTTDGTSSEYDSDDFAIDVLSNGTSGDDRVGSSVGDSDLAKYFDSDSSIVEEFGE